MEGGPKTEKGDLPLGDQAENFAIPENPHFPEAEKPPHQNWVVL